MASSYIEADYANYQLRLPKLPVNKVLPPKSKDAFFAPRIAIYPYTGLL